MLEIRQWWFLTSLFNADNKFKATCKDMAKQGSFTVSEKCLKQMFHTLTAQVKCRSKSCFTEGRKHLKINSKHFWILFVTFASRRKARASEHLNCDIFVSTIIPGKKNTLRRLTTVSSNFKLLNFDGSVLQIFISCCNNNDIDQMSNHC